MLLKLFKAGFLIKTITRNHVTTHYTIVPRETDPRWKGIYSIIFLNLFETSIDN